MPGLESKETYELSLKNIYRLLKQKDYPDYSDSVIPVSQMKGMTLLRFWESILISEFMQGKVGSVIWKKSEGRNRYKSDICNRSERLGYYEKYAGEIIRVAGQNVILKQMRVFEQFLTGKQYSPDILQEKLSCMLEIFEEKDVYYTDEVADYFRINFNQGKIRFGGKKNGMLFTFSWMLTMLTIHALMGPKMCGQDGRFFRENRLLQIQSMAEHFLREKQNTTCRLITGANSELPVSGLSKYHFFGRDEEMLNLMEMTRQGGRYLLHGLGGIGKTEILRQFVAQCKEEVIFPEIAVIPYYRSLSSSFIVAFPNALGKSDDEKLHNIFSYLSKKNRQQTLLILDNVDPSLESDFLYEEMLKLPVSIVLTSRATRLKGFCGYEISALMPEDGLKVFRDKYYMPLTETDRELFLDFLKDERNRHTLSILLFAGLANRLGWSVPELIEKAQREIVVQQEFSGTFRNLYTISHLKDNEQKILIIFSILPYQNYSIEELTLWLADYADDVKDTLNELVSYGWLETDGRSYSMHPVIAESITKDTTEEEITQFLKGILSEWKQYNDCVLYDIMFYPAKLDSEKEKITYLTKVLYSVAKRISCIERYRSLFLEVAVRYVYLISEKGLEMLRKFWKEYDKFCLEDKCLLVTAMYLNAKENCEKEYSYCYDNRDCVPKKLSLAFEAAYCTFVGTQFTAERNCLPELCRNLLKMSEEENERIICYGNLLALEGVPDKEKILQELKKYEDRNTNLSKEGELMVMLPILNYLDYTQNSNSIAAALEKMEAILSEAKDLSSSWSFIYHMKKGELFYIRNNYQESAKELLLARELQKSSSLSRRFQDGYNTAYYLAMGLMRIGRYEEAEELLLQLVDELPEDAPDKLFIWNLLGKLYQAWGEWDKCFAPLQKALELNTAKIPLIDADLKNNLSKYYHHMGDTEKEQEFLREAIPELERELGAENERVLEAKSRLILI